MVCAPTGALNMFFGSDLQYLIMEDVLVTKDTQSAQTYIARQTRYYADVLQQYDPSCDLTNKLTGGGKRFATRDWP